MQTYHIGSQIGRGGMAEVHLALQQGAGGFERLVVFKRINGWARTDGDYLKSFMLEARVAATMSHANIVTTLDVGEDDEGPYLVMEYLSGETLSFVLGNLRKREIGLPTHLACRIAASIGSALEFVHGITLPDGTPWRVVHRDVSPANVMCCYDGRIKLLDFGVVKVMSEEPTMHGVVKGKRCYLAPEQVLGLPLDRRTDVYQLGILFWEMLTGRKLYPDGGEAIARVTQGIVERPRAVAPDVPQELEDLVMWALRYDPDDRCPSARAFSEALQGYTPDLFGTAIGEVLQTFMQQTFPERLAYRMELERRTRALGELAREREAGQDAPPYVTRSTPAPVVLRTDRPPPRPAPGRRLLSDPAFVLTMLGVAAVTTLIVVTFGVSVLGTAPVAGRPAPEPATEVAAPATAPDPEPVSADRPAPATEVRVAPLPPPRPRRPARPRPVPTAPLAFRGDPVEEPVDEPVEEPPTADVAVVEPAPTAPAADEPTDTPEEAPHRIEELSDNLNPWKKK